MKGYRFIDDLTSDVMFEASGKTLRELFENSAEALLSIICRIKQVRPEKSIDISLRGDNARDLLLNWLQELITRVDTEEMFFSRFKIQKITETQLKAVIQGEPISPGKSGTLVKGVTYYNFSVKKARGTWKARVACDI